MAVYRVWRDTRADGYFVDVASALLAVEAVEALFPGSTGWRAEPDQVDFIATKGVVFDCNGTPVDKGAAR